MAKMRAGRGIKAAWSPRMERPQECFRSLFYLLYAFFCAGKYAVNRFVSMPCRKVSHISAAHRERTSFTVLASSQMPRAISGRQSSCPIVSQPKAR